MQYRSTCDWQPLLVVTSQTATLQGFEVVLPLNGHVFGQYFGIEWEGQTYLMTVCPYGCSTVPELFQTVAGTPLNALETIGFCPDIFRNNLFGKTNASTIFRVRNAIPINM